MGTKTFYQFFSTTNSNCWITDQDNDGEIDTHPQTEEVLETTTYYPFGMEMEGLNALDQSEVYQPLGYNGKERMVRNVLDYGARMYIAPLGRWNGVDPLASEMPSWSPYNYLMNNPINMIDPDGRAPENIGIDRDGNVVFDDGKNDGNLFLVNDDAGELNNLDELQKNSTQLAMDNVWVGNEEQLIDYVQSQ